MQPTMPASTVIVLFIVFSRKDMTRDWLPAGEFRPESRKAGKRPMVKGESKSMA